MTKIKTSLDTLLEFYECRLGDIAEALEVSRGSPDHWVKQGYIPEKHALQVEELTNGLIDARDVLVEARDARDFIKLGKN